MTMNLFWAPVQPISDYFPDDVKFALRKRNKGEPVNTNLNDSDLDYLRGLLDAGCKGAEEVIDAIHMYGTIHVEEI